MREVKAIVIWQPWAAAIALGFKRFETRSWPTDYRGPVLIHAGKHWTIEEQEFHGDAVDALHCKFPGDVRVFEFRKPPRLGAIMAIGDLVECWDAEHAVDTGMVDEVEGWLGDFGAGRFAWQLENVIRLESPISCRGQQGLWIPSAEIVDQVGEQISNRKAVTW